MNEGVRDRMEEEENRLYERRECGEIDWEEFERRKRELNNRFERVEFFMDVSRLYRRMT